MKDESKRQELLEMSNDPKNYILWFFYANRHDKRIFVPKRNPGWGWTFNFANPFLYFLLVLIGLAIYYLPRL